MLSHSCNDPYTHRTMCDACEYEGYTAAQAEWAASTYVAVDDVWSAAASAHEDIMGILRAPQSDAAAALLDAEMAAALVALQVLRDKARALYDGQVDRFAGSVAEHDYPRVRDAFEMDDVPF